MDVARQQDDKNSLAWVARLVWMFNEIETIARFHGDHHGLEAKASWHLKDCSLG
jgi:hypothetical protein